MTITIALGGLGFDWAAAANWAGALANVFLFGLGFLSLMSDRRRIAVLEQSDRKRFAENVFAWIEERSDAEILVSCRNGGNYAVYDVEIAICSEAGVQLGDRYRIDVMKPLEDRSLGIPAITDDLAGIGAQVCFRDPAGLSWVRQPNGALVERSGEAMKAIEHDRKTKRLVGGNRPKPS